MEARRRPWSRAAVFDSVQRLAARLDLVCEDDLLLVRNVPELDWGILARGKSRSPSGRGGFPARGAARRRGDGVRPHAAASPFRHRILELRRAAMVLYRLPDRDRIRMAGSAGLVSGFHDLPA